ncbi:two-component system sensor histidine kinase NtrB [Rhodoferax aquaticus]|uniref:histidine kinase n=1 Tax=Rhodoferax aquaticus TaxID=2527691 RepID=A0A515ELU5_9BURK|nr:ATP-binding protein [Rhodoferax aquaticus]QDL53640.1 PAS domain-containing protein [Rhodoferax aquaticus]
MASADPLHSWLGPTEIETLTPELREPYEFERLWQGFMTARLTLGTVLLALQAGLFISSTSHSKALVAICLAYFIGTVASKMSGKPARLGKSFNRTWGALVGLDVLVFSVLQLMQGTSINYTPLFALPILLASVLGTLRLALGTAAGVSMLLLANTSWNYLQNPGDATSSFVQAALSGVGYFVIAFLAQQLSARIASEGKRALHNQLAASVQRQVNELVIESMPEGVLIVDRRGRVRAANPAARAFLGPREDVRIPVFDLKDEPGWMPLLNLTQLSVATGQSHEEDVTLRMRGQGPRKIRARTSLAAPFSPDGDSLCVLFLQDQRELEARMRTEKLASMGRMSTAVAHEIRNPLAAIVQANALLDEDLTDPRLKKLTAMVGQNAKRLEKIVDDILNVSRVQTESEAVTLSVVNLHEATLQTCSDWAAQNKVQKRVSVDLPESSLLVRFDNEHLRRMLVNLLDNALRYATTQAQAIQINTREHSDQRAMLSVWSDGPPMDKSVERHLFEPFFSSESRSSGLGLFICRQMCERHGATIFYQRNSRNARGQWVEGNEFVITMHTTPLPARATQSETQTTPWQTTLY